MCFQRYKAKLKSTSNNLARHRSFLRQNVGGIIGRYHLKRTLNVLRGENGIGLQAKNSLTAELR